MQLADILAIPDPKERHRIIANRLGETVHRPWFEFQDRQACIARASSKPLPGPAGDAFCKGSIKVAGRVIRKINPAIWAMLQGVESPILKMFDEAVANGKSSFDWSEPQKWDACLIFTSDPKQLYALMEADGATAISQLARENIGLGDDWEEAEIDLVMGGIIEQVLRHAQTKVGYLKEAAERGDVRFFRENAASRSTTPASAGSSTITPNSESTIPPTAMNESGLKSR